jgi:hypothetical protein
MFERLGGASALGEDVAESFANRFAGTYAAKLPARMREPWEGRNRNHRPLGSLRRIWIKIKEGRITDPATLAALKREHAAVSKAA